MPQGSFPPINFSNFEVVRAYYYTFCDDGRVKSLSKKISETEICISNPFKLSPQIIRHNGDGDFKGDDIKICIDSIHHALHSDADVIYLFSGDGDFVPLVEELQKMGKYVFVGAFSFGLNKKLEEKADFFWDLDEFYGLV